MSAADDLAGTTVRPDRIERAYAYMSIVDEAMRRLVLVVKQNPLLALPDVVLVDGVEYFPKRPVR